MGNFDDDVEKTAVLGVADIKPVAGGEKRASLIVINGRSVGKMYKLEPHSVLGRAPDSQVLIEDEGVSRRHAFIEARAGAHFLSDNNSTNGVFVNGDKIGGETVLRDGDRVQIGSKTILKFSYQDAVEENYQKHMYDKATRDALTGCYNKKYFADQLKTEFAYCYRHKTLLSLTLFDIDYFKKLNDGWGHLAGDFVLKDLAGIVRKTLRTEDIFARYGGEEFGIILRDTDEERAFLIAERTRRAVEGNAFMWEGERLPVQISLGVSTLREQNHASPKMLVKTADGYLYKAKDAGRNRTECELMNGASLR